MNSPSFTFLKLAEYKRGPKQGFRTFAIATFVLPSMVVLATACTPASQSGASGAGTAAGGPSSEWKEGYGGDTQAIEVVRQIESFCFRARSLRGAVLNSAMEAVDRNGQEVDVTSGLCQLIEKGELRVEMVEQPMVKGEPKDMANYPYEKPRRLEVKRAFWSDKSVVSDKREALLLHELVPLIGLDDTDYVRSTRLFVALSGLENRVTIESCDGKRIEAVFASGNAELLRFYSNHLGNRLCDPAMYVMKRHAAKKSLGEELTREVQSHYAWGVFTRIAAAKTHDEITEASAFLQKVFTEIPESLADWTPDTCQAIGELRPGHFRCGTIAQVIAGASPRLKYRHTPVTASLGLSEFDRASIVFMEMLDIRRQTFRTTQGNPLFNRSGNLSSAVVRAALEAQNWTLLMYLGQIQRRANPSAVASEVLLKDINFSSVKRNTVGDELTDEYDYPVIRKIGSCLESELRIYAAGILDGIRTDSLVCGTIDSI